MIAFELCETPLLPFGKKAKVLDIKPSVSLITLYRSLP